MPVKQEMPADESSVPTVPSGQKPLKKTKVKITDFSFANKLEDCRLVRELLRDGGRLIRWESQEKANVISLSALGLNSKVMCMLADHHCSSTSSVKPPSIAFLKAQVGIGLANTKEKQSIRYKKSLKADMSIFYTIYNVYDILLIIWCPFLSACFPWQIWKLRTLLAVPLQPVAIHHDAWNMKKLFPCPFVVLVRIHAATLSRVPIAEFLCHSYTQ